MHATAYFIFICRMMLTCPFTETHGYILFLHAEATMLKSYTTSHYQAAHESQHMKHVSMKVSE